MRSIKLYLLVGVVGAVGALAWGAGAGWSLAVGIGAPALAVLLPRFAAGALAGGSTPSAREDAAGRADHMSGTEFEDDVATVARTRGLPVIMTPLSGDWAWT